jgi:hypothetical protein
MGLLRSDIQNEINKAHIKIDELTWLMAKRYTRSQKYQSIADTVFKGINYIKVLENETNLTDKEVEIFIQALRETLSLHEVGYQPTTLEFVYNQPAINITNTLSVSGTPNVFPRYDTGGTSFTDSSLYQSGGSLYWAGANYYIGDGTTGSANRLLQTGGTGTINLTVRTSGELKLQGDTITSPSPVILGQTLKFEDDTVSIDTIKDDDTFASPSTTALVTEEAIDTRIDTEVSALTAAISANNKTTGSGLNTLGSVFRLGGSTTVDATLTLGSGVTFSATSSTASLGVKYNEYASLVGPSGSILSNLTVFEIQDGVLNYEIDQSGSYGLRSVTDKNYQDSTIGGNAIAAVVKNPTLSEDGYAITWNNASGWFELSSVGGGTATGNAATLDGFTADQFLRSDASDIATGIITFDRSASSSLSGSIGVQMKVSSDNSYGIINVNRDGVSDITGVSFWSTDSSAYIDARALTFTSTATTGTAPFTVSSITQVNNLNAQYLNGASADQAATSTTLVQRSGSGGINVTSIAGITASAVVTNLNADKLDGLHATSFFRSDQTQSLTFDTTYGDGVKLRLGNPIGISLYHSGDSFMKLEDGNPFRIINQSSSNIFRATSTQAILYYNGSQKLVTASTGLVATGTIIADNFIDSSDARKKTAIKPVNVVDLDMLDYVDVVEYQLKDDESKRPQIGVIAQELQRKYPHLVTEDDDGYLGVDYRSLFMIAISKMQKLERRVKILENARSH